MRRYIATLVAAALWVTASTAAAETQAYRLGLKGGVNQSKLRGDQVADYLSEDRLSLSGAVDHYATGGMFGGFIRRYFSESFALQLEALFVQKGGNGPAFGEIDVDYPGNVVRQGGFNGEVTLDLDYVEFPLMAVFDFESDERVDLIFEGGVAVAFNTKASLGLNGVASVELPDLSTRSVTIDQRQDITDQVNSVDFLGTLGLGCEIDLRTFDLILDGRYTFGLTSIDRTNPKKDVWNGTFSVMAGLSWPIGK